MKSTRLMLVDDQVLFVESLKTVLEQDAEEILITGIAHDGNEALELLADARPDIILMDVRMPGMDGVEATRRIHQQAPEIQIIMLTTFDDDKFVFDALDYGAVGYLLKNIPPLELITLIRAVRDGSVLLSSGIAKKLVSRASGNPHSVYSGTERVRQRGAEGLVLLSRRETEVLQLMVKGYGNRQIIEELFLAEQTVRNHISNIYSKLEVKDRYEAVQIAIREGFV